jgi:hypothetical protein
MTMRYEAIRQDDPVLRERLKDLAKVRRRFGYRRLHVFRGGCEDLNSGDKWFFCATAA